MGRAFHGLVRVLTVRGIVDTQCGFKLFRGPVAHELFSRMRMDGFSFDVEDYGMGESTTIGLRIRRRNLAALKIPITEVRTRRSAFLVEIAPGIYRFGGCRLRPADPVGADEALLEAGERSVSA